MKTKGVFTLAIVTVMNISILFVFQKEVRAEFPICTEPGWQGAPMITGNIVVYVDSRNGNGDIYAYDLATKTEFPICTDPSEQGEDDFRVDGNFIIWLDSRNGNSDIHGYDLATHTEFPICTDTSYQAQPAISGNFVVWKDCRNDSGDIYGYNLDTNTEFPICTAQGQQEKPTIDGQFVIWPDERNGGVDIYGFDLETQTEFTISTGPVSTAAYAIDGNFVVWAESNIIYGFNLATSTKFRISSNEGFSPAVSGNFVVWASSIRGIYGYDLIAEHEFLISNTEGNTAYIAIQNNENIVVWRDNRNGNYDIYAYDLLTNTEFPVCVNPFDEWTFDINGDYIVFNSKQNGSWNIYGFSLSDNEEFAFATEIMVGQVIQGSTDDDSGVDVTTDGYNDVVDTWYYFVPDSTDKYTISVCGSDFDTTLAVFDEDLVEVEFNDNFCGDQSKLVLRGKAGKKYYVRIAGYDGASGNYTLSIIKDSPEPLRSDVNFDGKVDMGDFAVMAFEWLSDNQN